MESIPDTGYRNIGITAAVGAAGNAVLGVERIGLDQLGSMLVVNLKQVDGDIKSIADLKGKRVSVGDAGSGVEFNARQIPEAYDWCRTDRTRSAWQHARRQPQAG